eukprot:5753096-Prymnesium_polylepis.1
MFVRVKECPWAWYGRGWEAHAHGMRMARSTFLEHIRSSSGARAEHHLYYHPNVGPANVGSVVGMQHFRPCAFVRPAGGLGPAVGTWRSDQSSQKRVRSAVRRVCNRRTSRPSGSGFVVRSALR